MLESRRILLVAFVFAASACGQLPINGSGSQESDWAAIVALENEAKAIAKTTGCSTVSACRAAAVGNRACGGPRYYIPYCSISTDSVPLFRKLGEVASAENAYNRKYGIVSTCEFRMPPTSTFTGGQCGPVTQPRR